MHAHIAGVIFRRTNIHLLLPICLRARAFFQIKTYLNFSSFMRFHLWWTLFFIALSGIESKFFFHQPRHICHAVALSMKLSFRFSFKRQYGLQIVQPNIRIEQFQVSESVHHIFPIVCFLLSACQSYTIYGTSLHGQ